MALNFCHPALQPSISSDTVSADGYEVENLIQQPSLFAKSSGFLVERFIKPPVCVTVVFSCNIEVHRILIDPIVGGQKSCGFEILTNSTKCTKNKFTTNDDCSQLSGKTTVTEMDVYTPVGRKYYTNDPKILCFINRGYKKRRDFVHVDFEAEQASYIVGELRHSRVTALGAVSSVMVRITRTIGSSIPAMKSLEIWGQPAYSCPQNIVHQISHIAQRLDTPKLQASTSTDIVSERISNTDAQLENEMISNDALDNLNVPSEFKDALTIEVMALPMLLPSGHNIDQSTLDKYVENEAHWGRAPNDPFTGVVFTSESKAILNGGLKARIDQYLMENSATVGNVARTLGRSNRVSNSPVNQSKTENVTRPPASASGIVHHSSSLTSKKEGKDKSNPAAMPRQMACHLRSRPYYNKRTMESPGSTCDKFPSPEAHNISSSCTSENIVTQGHASALTTSLDAALSLTLLSLPSFSKSATFTEQTDDLCMLCNCSPSLTNRYSIDCGHFICKSCLVVNTTGSCTKCQFHYTGKNVKKFHH